MKVYHPEGSSTTLMVTPGALVSEVPAEWKDDHGGLRRFDVVFQHGVATVDRNLGELLIEKGYANRTILRRVTNTILRAIA